ncbi:hypothetical protein [Gordonia sputi]
MTESGDEVRFVSGDERLARILADPDRRARVGAITAEMDLIDQRYRTAALLLDEAVATTAAEVGAGTTAEVLTALQRHLTAAGVRELGITLTFDDHDATVPWNRIAGHPRRDTRD